MSRIKLNDTTLSAVSKMSEGNPGAGITLMEMLTEGEKIDPDSALGGFGSILSLDTHGIYGTDIYIFHNDICGGEISKVIAVLRACQLGLFSPSILKDACSRQDRSGVSMVPVADLYAKVKERLPDFDCN